MSSRGFGTLMSALDPPLIVVTTAEAGELAGCLVGFHAQSSIQPRRYCVWLSKANHTYRVALRSSYLAIHFLAADDLDLADLFGTKSGDTVDKFAGLETAPGPDGVPLLTQCPRQLITRRSTLLDEGGDHVSVITEPIDVHGGGRFTPLRLSHTGHLVAGHGYWERPDPPTERAAGR
jgi:flavin reductase (DIM6/NTAB) family NADH-FMN oxidoreductase RutF